VSDDARPEWGPAPADVCERVARLLAPKLKELRERKAEAERGVA
jgi:hypothetical protein